MVSIAVDKYYLRCRQNSTGNRINFDNLKRLTHDNRKNVICDIFDKNRTIPYLVYIDKT